jgi:hypothetical protein
MTRAHPAPESENQQPNSSRDENTQAASRRRVRVLDAITGRAAQEAHVEASKGTIGHICCSSRQRLKYDPIELSAACACDDELVEVGENWGYRARGIDPLVEVEVHRIGTQKPARVLVRFVSSDFEGREEWVPPARLKVPWKEAPAFAEREARWDAVDTDPNLRDTSEEYAIDVVFREVINDSLASVNYRMPGSAARRADESMGRPWK